MLRPGPWRRRRLGFLAAVLLLLAGGAAAFLLLHSPGNVSNPNLSFNPPGAATKPSTRPRPVLDTFEWPRYGFDAGRTRFFAGGRGLAPPLRIGWRYDDHALLEFPPVIFHGSLFFIDDNGFAKALDKHTGHVLWQRRVGTLAAASPAIGAPQRAVFVPLLSTDAHATSSQNPGNGRFAALSMRDGHVLWSRPIPAGSESSPIAYGDSVYFGDQSGTVYSLRASDGHQQWTYHASGAVKGGPAYTDGILYFGDYAGRAYALDAHTGRQIWAVSTAGARFGFGSGNFYATPAVAYGRVYLGNTDGRVYSFAMRTGQLAWATGTGAYVYSSAAVAAPPGLGPTVYIGSYDGTMYAFDARSGAVRWTHAAGGKISGAGTIIGDVLYFSDLGDKKTIGLDVRTGHQVFIFPDGAFNPVVADLGAIYLDGYGIMYQMLAAGPGRR